MSDALGKVFHSRSGIDRGAVAYLANNPFDAGLVHFQWSNVLAGVVPCQRLLCGQLLIGGGRVHPVEHRFVGFVYFVMEEELNLAKKFQH